jgi:hypothetical protein
MHSPGHKTDHWSNGMAAMIGKRDRRKPVAAFPESLYQDGLLKPSTVISTRRGRECRL